MAVLDKHKHPLALPARNSWPELRLSLPPACVQLMRTLELLVAVVDAPQHALPESQAALLQQQAAAVPGQGNASSLGRVGVGQPAQDSRVLLLVCGGQPAQDSGVLLSVAEPPPCTSLAPAEALHQQRPLL